MKFDDLTLFEMAVVATSNLGGQLQYIHGEEIAVELHKLAPDRFSWSLPQFNNIPDKTLTERELRRAKAYEFMQGSSAKSGWKLTSKGIKWLKDINLSDHQTNRSLPKKQVDRFRSRITNHPLYRIYLNSKIDKTDHLNLFADLLHVGMDRPKEIIWSQFDKLMMKAVACDDNSVIKFLKKCRRIFKHFLKQEQELKEK